ncbi:MAG: nucleotidyltransferase domain-containing protein [Promethearchaeota archaeon]
MKKLKSLNEIKEDLKFCRNFWAVIYGSYANKEFIPERSDIDVAIITQTKDRQKNFKIWLHILEQVPVNYDFRIFELLPLYIQIEIIKNYDVIYGDPLEISEYFYHYRVIWKDMADRFNNNQFYSIKEKLKLIGYRKKTFLKL